MSYEFDGDIRYLQEPDAPFSQLDAWVLTKNVFERKLACNLRAGMALDLDLEPLKSVLGSAVLIRDKTITVDLQLLSPGRIRMQVVEVSDALLPLWADCSGNLAYALDWFWKNGEYGLRLSACADAFFWIHAPVKSAGSVAARRTK
ncbi:MAG: hypothetical protein KME20_05500 [Kaiparowitsia implicata GSE-PSE-MK54-09C]|jgi:hypothetical protein|nr:hypothetical protein [Kaiparowitsia implicata GSE-PSE-MK54-09C]